MSRSDRSSAELVAELGELRQRVLSLEDDASRRKRAADAHRFILDGTSVATGEEFFQSTVRHLAIALHTRFAFIAESTDADATRIRMLALWEEDGYAETFEYDVEGTPCAHVVGREPMHFPSGVRERFPG